MGVTKPYYGGDAFTSDLRWALLGVVSFLLLGVFILGVAAAISWWVDIFPPRRRLPPLIDWGAPDEIELPQDRAVRIVETGEEFVFDQDEWEGKLSL